MKIDLRKIDDVVVIDLQGKLVSGVGDEVLREALREVMADDWKRVLLNLSEVSNIDSAGVGELVAGLRSARSLGVQLKATQLGGRVAHVLGLAQILPLLDVYATEKEALESFETGKGSDHQTATAG
jgi:anti-sigma B factor antagonist